MALQEAIKNKATELETLRNNVKTLRATIDHAGNNASGEDRTKLNAMVDAGIVLQEEYDRLKLEEKMLGGGQEEQAKGIQRAIEQAVTRPARKTWGQTVRESAEYKSVEASNGQVRDLPRVTIGNFKDYVGSGRKAIYAGVDAQGGYAVVNDRQAEILDIARQQPRSVIDLVNKSTTNSDLVEYMLMSARTNNAAVVSERTATNGTEGDDVFGLKPESSMTLDLKTAAVKTIAAWIGASRQVLNDAPRLRQLIDDELTYEVERVLESTLITDILAWSGIASRVHATSGARFDAADNIADTLRRAITDLYLAFYAPDGIVLNPAQGEALELLKDDNNQYMKVYDSATMRVWRVPVVETAAITAGTALVANFKMGVTLWDREQTQIFTGQPNDYMLRNAWAILAELRAAWAVVRPLAVEKITGL